MDGPKRAGGAATTLARPREREDSGGFRFDKSPFDNQLTQFLQDAVRFTVVVGVVEALVFVVAFVLASR